MKTYYDLKLPMKNAIHRQTLADLKLMGAEIVETIIFRFENEITYKNAMTYLKNNDIKFTELGLREKNGKSIDNPPAFILRKRQIKKLIRKSGIENITSCIYHLARANYAIVLPKGKYINEEQRYWIRRLDIDYAFMLNMKTRQYTSVEKLEHITIVEVS